MKGKIPVGMKGSEVCLAREPVVESPEAVRHPAVEKALGRIKVAVIGTVGLPAKYGGFETLADQLVANLKYDFDLTVYCSGRSYAEKPRYFNGARLVYIPFRANGIQSIPYDMASLLHAALDADAVILLGTSGALVLPLLKLIARQKIIVNMDGIEWKRAKWNRLARAFLKISEKTAAAFADEVVADNVEIQRYLAGEYGIRAHLIEYGGDHMRAEMNTNGLSREFGFLGGVYALAISRIEPDNNIHMMLEAFEKAADPQFVVVGNWDRSSYGRGLRKKYKDCRNIVMVDAIYDLKKLNVLRTNCSLYFHGHSAGGTNPSLVEAMYLGLPVAAFDVPFNRQTTENRALYFRTVDDIIRLAKSVADFGPAGFGDNAAAMSEIAHRRYRWSLIARKYAGLLRKPRSRR